MRIIKIASENTDKLSNLNFIINQTKQEYENQKRAIEEQYVPKLEEMNKQRDFLIIEVQKEENIQVQQYKQMQQQVQQPVQQAQQPVQQLVQPAQQQPVQPTQI